MKKQNINFFYELEKSFKKNPKAKNFFNNIFSFRIFGNKTHGDMTEVLLDHYINTQLNNFSSIHIGKKHFRAKKSEEDLEIKIEKTKQTFYLSLKNYGEGPLQIRTDKNTILFNKLEKTQNLQEIKKFLKEFFNINLLIFLYNEKKSEFRVCTINFRNLLKEIHNIEKITKNKRRKHPIYEFSNKNSEYLFEVRYGDAKSNALQRGIWTKTLIKKKRNDNVLTTIFEGNYESNYNYLETIKKLSLLNEIELNELIKFVKKD